MNRKKITGERLFYLYAFPCTEGRHEKGKIDAADYEALKCLKLGGQPERELLVRSYEDAAKAFADYKKKRKLADDDWTLEVVSDFWHHHHGQEGECRVRLAVIRVIHKLMVKVECEGKEIIAVNMYGLQAHIGETYYIHKNMLIERV